LGRRVEHLVSDGRVHIEERSRGRRLDQVDLVGDDASREAGAFSRHEEAIEHTHMRRRLGAGEDEDNLIRVGHQHLFDRVTPVVAAWCAAREDVCARQNLMDLSGAIRPEFDEHTVAHRGQIAGAAMLLELAAQLA
jgi:hypothetical protein